MTRVLVLTFVIMLGPLGGLRAQEADVEVIRRGKQATLLVEVETNEGVVAGSAFCIDPSGLFVTNAHVVDVQEGAKVDVRLVWNEDGEKRRVTPARVLRTSLLYDLALLKCEPIPGVVPLELGVDDDLIETKPVTSFGYPFGDALAVREGGPPNVTVTTGRITALRRKDGALLVVQIDGLLNPGNSGGPLLDSRGRVVGVLTASVLGAGVNFAMAPGRLAAFLATPDIECEIPPLSFQKRAEPVKCKVALKPSPVKSAKPLDRPEYRLHITSILGDLRILPLKQVGPGSYEGEFVPVPIEAETNLLVDATFQIDDFRSVSIHIVAQDRPVKVGRQTLRLKDLAYVEHGATPRILTRDGRSLPGHVEGVNAMRFQDDQGGLVKIDLEKAAHFACWTLDAPVPTIQLGISVVAHEAGQSLVAGGYGRHVPLEGAPTLEERTAIIRSLPDVYQPEHFAFDVAAHTGGLLDDGSHSALGTSRAIRPPRVDFGPSRDANSPDVAGMLVKSLPAPASDWMVGGGGRYLLFFLKTEPKLAIFDVNAGAFVGTIPLPGPTALAAAGGKVVVVVDRDANRLLRWSLETLQQEAEFALPFAELFNSVAMGSDSAGPLICTWNLKQPVVRVANSGMLLIDPAGAKVQLIPNFFQYNDDRLSVVASAPFTASAGIVAMGSVGMRVSADGRSIGLWNTGVSPTGVYTLLLRGPRFQSHHEHADRGYIAPDAEGRRFFTGFGDILRPDGRQVDGQKRPPIPVPAFVPSPEPGYYVSVDGLPFVPNGNPGGPFRVTLHDADGKQLASIAAPEELASLTVDRKNGAQLDPLVDKRFHFVPSARLLITVPPGEDHLVLRKLNLAFDPARPEK